jgi:hypothetical protein
MLSSTAVLDDGRGCPEFPCPVYALIFFMPSYPWAVVGAYAETACRVWVKYKGDLHKQRRRFSVLAIAARAAGAGGALVSSFIPSGRGTAVRTCLLLAGVPCARVLQPLPLADHWPLTKLESARGGARKQNDESDVHYALCHVPCA